MNLLARRKDTVEEGLRRCALVASQISQVIIEPRHVGFEVIHRHVYNMLIYKHGDSMMDVMRFAIRRGARILIGKQSDTLVECRAQFDARVSMVNGCLMYWMRTTNIHGPDIINTVAEQAWDLALQQVKHDRIKALEKVGLSHDLINQISVMAWPEGSNVGVNL